MRTPGRVWHTDMSFTARPPRATLLYALEVPVENGVALGNTLFIERRGCP